MSNNRGFTLVELIACILMVLILVVLISGGCACDVGGMGPTNHVTGTVLSKHFDSTKDGSNFMVTTDNGTFEVDNGFLLDTWNADELYGSIVIGKKYSFTTKGNKHVNFWMQSYPYIVSAQEVQ